GARRRLIGRDFDQIHDRLGGDLEGPFDGHDANVGAFVVDQLDLADAELLVNARTFLGRRRGFIGSANGSRLLRAMEEQAVADLLIQAPTRQNNSAMRPVKSTSRALN